MAGTDAIGLLELSSIGVALRVAAKADRIVFRSDHYFVQLGRLRLRLPRWFSPGQLRIDHIDFGNGEFDFVLDLRHRLLGELIHQRGRFRDR